MNVTTYYSTEEANSYTAVVNLADAYNNTDDVYNYTNMTTPIAKVHPQYAVTMRIVFCIFYIIVGVPSNLLTIVAVLATPSLRAQVINIFVAALAITDFVFCAFNLPIQTVRWVNQDWILSIGLCKFVIYLYSSLVGTSMFIMTFIALTRYIAIVWYQSRKKTFKRWQIASMIAFSWIFPFVMVLPTLLGAWGEFQYKEDDYTCDFAEKDGKDAQIILYGLLCGLTIPTTTFCYLGILISVRRHGSANMAATDKLRRDRENALTRMVVIIYVAFWLLLLPKLIVEAVWDEQQSRAADTVTGILLWTVSIINPLIYGFMNKNYRKAYKKVAYSVLSWIRSGFDESKRLSKLSIRTNTTRNISSSGSNNSRASKKGSHENSVVTTDNGARVCTTQT